MALSTMNSPHARLLASLQNSLSFFSVRAWRDMDELWCSNVRTLPAPLGSGHDSDSGTIRQFVDPFSHLQSLVLRDVVVPISNVPSALHGSLNITAAAALLGGPQVLLGVIRGPHPEDATLLVGELLPHGALAASAGFLVGTWAHTEHFAFQDLAELDPLHSMSLGVQSSISAFENTIRRLHSKNLFGDSATHAAPVLSVSEIQNLSALLTGMVTSELNDAPALMDPRGSGRELHKGEVAWLLPVKVTSFELVSAADMRIAYSYFDRVLANATEGEDCLRVLEGLADTLAPLVKDLIRHAIATRPTHDVEAYLKVANSEKFKRATALWQASQA